MPLARASSPFDVVLFDVGGVLLTNGWDHRERAAVIAQFGVDLAAFESRHAQPNDAWERDQINVRQYLNATVFYEGRPFTQDQFLDAMKAQSVPIPATGIPVLKELAEAGRFLIGALNNEARELHEYRMQEYGLGELFDLQLSSCYLGLRKPEAAIYSKALDILGRPAKRVLFIDDRDNNAAAARAAGMHAIQFTGEEALRRELEQLGVL